MQKSSFLAKNQFKLNSADISMSYGLLMQHDICRNYRHYIIQLLYTIKVNFLPCVTEFYVNLNKYKYIGNIARDTAVATERKKNCHHSE